MKVFFCEFCKVSKNNFAIEHLGTTVSAHKACAKKGKTTLEFRNDKFGKYQRILDIFFGIPEPAICRYSSK